MKLWHGILSIMLILTLPLTGCGKSSEDTDLHNYLTQVTPLIEEISDITADLWDIAEEAGPFGVAEPEKTLANYKEKYEDLLLRLSAIECPDDAVKLREYTIAIINLHIQMIDAILEYSDTRDPKHMEKAESYAADIDEQRNLASDEWDRLSDMAGKENGISIVQIFLGLLALGVAVVIAMFVLELTLGVGFGIIAGICAAIGAIVEKIKGGSKRRRQEQVRQLGSDSASLKSQEGEEHNVWEIYRKEWETASPEKRAELNKRMLRWQELMKNGWTASQAYIRVMEEESDGDS